MIRTLIVDDDFAVGRMHRRFVEALECFEVAGVLERGQAVVPFLAEHDVDLVLLDVHLPDLSGVHVLEAIRAGGFAVGVIMVTAESERETVRRAVGHGVDGYLVKPFMVEELNRRLRDFQVTKAKPSSGQNQANRHEMAQAEIDQWIENAAGRSPSAASPSTAAATERDDVGRLPKGFSSHTLHVISSALQRGNESPFGDLSARDVAESCGVSRVSARRYLEYLVSIGRAELRPRYGATGRPEHRFRSLG